MRLRAPNTFLRVMKYSRLAAVLAVLRLSASLSLWNENRIMS